MNVKGNDDEDYVVVMFITKLLFLLLLCNFYITLFDLPENINNDKTR